jgi:hypothetical protein
MYQQVIFIIIFVVCIIAICYKAYLYYQKRKKGHDRYRIVKNTNGQCPDLDMMGFKFSVMLILATVNILVLMYLVCIINSSVVIYTL